MIAARRTRPGPGVDAAEPRPLRRDALRNQQLVLDAARDVIAVAGIEASMEAIAAQAGVGVGTVYRRFPNKEALIDELVRVILDELITSAQAALARGDGSGLEIFLRALGRSLAEHRAYVDKLVGHTRAECAQLLRSLIADLHAQARAHRRIGAAVTVGDIMATIWGLRGIVETTGSVAPHAWERHLDIHLAGLRSAAADDRPSPRPSVSARQLDRITAHGETPKRSVTRLGP